MNNIKLEKLESQGSQTVLSNSNDKLYYVCQEKEQINNTNYRFRRNGFSNLLVPQRNLVFPLEIDCEYKSEGLGCLANDDILYSTLNITTQMKHPLSGATHMFLHREIAAHYEEVGDLEISAFALALKSLREEKRLTQLELAKLAGLQPMVISHFECSLKAPSFHTLRKLAKALDVSADDLLGLKDKKTAVGFRHEQSLSDEDRQFIQDLISLRAKKKNV